jgi:hypothetical protein
VYSGLLRANWGADALARLALVGTSLASQGASSSLFLALTRDKSEGGGGGGGGDSEELHALLQARGGCVEALLPDPGGAHGIATSVHLFPRARVLATGLVT